MYQLVCSDEAALLVVLAELVDPVLLVELVGQVVRDEQDGLVKHVV
jgi:hypothetical protein